MKPTAFHFLVLTVAVWLQRHLEEHTAYLLAENAVALIVQREATANDNGRVKRQKRIGGMLSC